MRIIAGSLKGRTIQAPKWDGLRPTSDRLRETLFNVLAPRVDGARVLDGFAGTGAVGLEALSRGASHVTFVERDPRAIALIETNLRRCGVKDRYAIIRAGFSDAVARGGSPDFDIIFLDPPYGATALVTGTRRGGTIDRGRYAAGGRARQAGRVAGGIRACGAHARAALRRQRAVLLPADGGRRARERQDSDMSVIAIYPGSFDPLTNGHVDIIQRGARLFDRIVIAILVNLDKSPLFTVPERVDIAREVFHGHANVEVDTFDGLLVDYARRKRAGVIVRGLRAISDFEYEMQMALMNRRLNSEVETVFMMPGEPYTYVSSRLVKEIVALGGSVHGLVPDLVERRLRDKKLARETLRA